MNSFTIYTNRYLTQNIKGFYHTNYTGHRNIGNPDYLNDLKNTYDKPDSNDAEWYKKQELNKLENAIKDLRNVLKSDLITFDKNLTVCIVPRSKAENTYSHNQLLFKKVVQEVINQLNFQDGSNYIMRHTNTKTTHLAHTQYGGNGSMPYVGITKDTCTISSEVQDKDILLIDDIYTKGVNIDEDAIQALLDNGAKSVIFYAVGKTK